MTDDVKSIRDRRKDIQKYASGASLADIKELERVIKARDSKALEAAVTAIHATEKVTPEHLERTFNARRRGSIQALRAISQWALDQREGCDVEGFAAYTEVSDHCLTLIDNYNAGREAFGDEPV
jgi:hypothetical protein